MIERTTFLNELSSFNFFDSSYRVLYTRCLFLTALYPVEPVE